MAKTEFIEILLTCGSWQEAQAIADALLERHLVACIELLEVQSKNWWQGRLEESREVKVIMQSVATNFQTVGQVVSQLHSYEIPALHALPITAITPEAAKWLEQETAPN